MDLPSKGIPEVPKEIIHRILAEVGFPIINFKDLGITEQDALELFVYPAMAKYFAYNPNQHKTKHNIQPNVKIEVPFPTEDTFGVLQARIPLYGSVNSPSGKFNIFRDTYSRSIRGVSRGRDNIYDNPYYTRSVRLAEETANASYITLSKAGNMEIDREGRMLRGYSTIGGELIVTWARCSHKWADVRFEHESDVIDIAKAHALRYFGMLRSQMDAGTGVTMNGEIFISRADAIDEKIKEKWEGKTKIVVMR